MLAWIRPHRKPIVVFNARQIKYKFVGAVSVVEAGGVVQTCIMMIESEDPLKPLKSTIEAGCETPEQWQEVLRQILFIMDCKTGTIHLLDPESQLLELRAHQGIPEELMPVVRAIPIGKGIAGAAAERREPVDMCNLQTDTSGTARPDAKKTKVAGNIAVPIIDREGNLKGTVGVGKFVPYAFSRVEVDRLLEICQLLPCCAN
jgi:signal transduction protein with GAF and PtsI domain